MMHAYDEKYLSDAMKNLGEAFDYTATVLNIPMDDFLDVFIVSAVAEQFASGYRNSFQVCQEPNLYGKFYIA